MKKTVLFCLLFFFFLCPFSANAIEVIAVPYRADDPSIPHPAYSERAVIFKAIARDTGSCAINYRWDFNGDSVWDTNWITSSSGVLESSFIFSDITMTKLFIALVEVQCGESSVMAAYPVVVYSDIPTQENADTATHAQLTIMKEVAIDEALWYLHKSIVRSGNDTANIQGYSQQNGLEETIAATSLFLQVFEENGHFPAYPPGTYSDFGQTLSPDFYTANDFRWRNDPYAEDALRLLNYLLNQIGAIAIPSEDESDDSSTPIPGTNDGLGFTVGYQNPEYGPQSLALGAIAKSGLAGAMAQVGDPSRVLGKSLEFIVQQLVDAAIASQIDQTGSPSAIGGWYYSPCINCSWNTSYASSHMSGGWYVALMTAEEAMGAAGVHVNNRVKERIPNMLFYNQAADGGPKYRNSTSSSIFEPAGLSLLASRWLGWDRWEPDDTTPAGYPFISTTKGGARQVYDRYYNYIAGKWALPSTGGMLEAKLWSDGNYNSQSDAHAWIYSIYNIRAGAGDAIDSFGLHDWYHEFNVDYVKQQQTDGSFMPGPGYWLRNFLDQKAHTAYAVMTMSGGHVDGPVALAHASTVQVIEGCAGSGLGQVTFGHNDSFHTVPDHGVVEYQWIFEGNDPDNPNFDQVIWGQTPDGEFSLDGKTWRSSNPNATPLFTYEHAGIYYAALRVVDDTAAPDGPLSDVFIIQIEVFAHANNMPMVEPGGPYVIIAGQPLDLQGQVIDVDISCNPNEIASMGWDLDGDGQADDFNQAAGRVNWTLLDALNLPMDQPVNITLSTTDSAGYSDEKTTTLIIQGPIIISGRVAIAVAGHSNLSVIGATVSLEGTSYSTVTDINGNFNLAIPNVPPGTYALAVSAQDLVPLSQEITLPDSQPFGDLEMMVLVQGDLDQAVADAIQHWDAMGDGKIGLEEAIHALQVVSGVRPGNDEDDDGDGYTENQGDCDDTDSGIHPGAAEICDDLKDNDCDGQIDQADSDCVSGCIDNDGDGYGVGTGCLGPDCDDDPATGMYANPGMPEICDGFDNNCNGSTDEGCAVCGNGIVEGAEVCDDGNTDACGSCNAACDGLGSGTCPPGEGCAVDSDCTSGICNELGCL
jgi:hypothetical protein